MTSLGGGLSIDNMAADYKERGKFMFSRMVGQVIL